ncbi:AAA family ATPase [Bordetella sp. 15P40C-2]|uniref:AAA family ATPase n=1 Tax=Bordetella sp. 15P40C-2 TaxID=2572246 RepID=UPI001F27AF62|nr:AAA family ATPase [Bordetella sp. 15P40C-2]
MPSAVPQCPSMPILNDLGPRICILGPSNSGKSTLADAIARKRGLPVIHLDQLFHIPYSDWVPRPAQEFRQLHDEAIMQEQWVMDGNYTSTLAQRLSRATGFILLDVPTSTSLWRYLRRTWFERDRRGGLAGGRDTVKWQMLHHIAVVTPRNRRRYGDLYERVSLPKIRLATTNDLNHFYDVEQLSRH